MDVYRDREIGIIYYAHNNKCFKMLVLSCNGMPSISHNCKHIFHTFIYFPTFNGTFQKYAIILFFVNIHLLVKISRVS